MRSFAAAAATVSVAVAAAALSVACGGSEQPATGGPAVVPADAAVYVSVQSDLDSAQWKQVEKLVLRFPDGPGAVERLHGDLGNGVNYEDDLEPALGPTVELVWLDFRNDGEDVVALTQPDDEGKLRELARKSEEPVVVDEVEGWSAVARSQAVIDRYRDALDAGTLADDDRYDETTSELPTEALAQVYVDGERTTNALQSTLQERGAETGTLESGGRLDSGAAALEAADDGFRLTALFRTHGVPDEVTDVGALLGEVPAGAFAAVDFHGSRSTSEQLTPERLAPYGRFGPALRALSTLVEGEGVLYARPAGKRTELTLLLAPPDAQATKGQLDLLAATLGEGNARQTTIADVEATVVDVDEYSIVYAAFDDRLAVSTSPDGIRALREEDARLVDEDRYRAALDAAGVPDDEHVVAYADLHELIPHFEDLVASHAVVPVVPTPSRETEPLRSLVASTRTDGDETTARLFLEIRG